jgi:hypothetical protein
MVGRDHQKLAILKPSGDDVDLAAPDPALAREDPLLFY